MLLKEMGFEFFSRRKDFYQRLIVRGSTMPFVMVGLLVRDPRLTCVKELIELRTLRRYTGVGSKVGKEMLSVCMLAGVQASVNLHISSSLALAGRI